jgi:hypothetical protein
MQYQVPQFIDLEDRIIGPLTLKQFLYLAFGGALIFVFWFLFQFYLWIIVSIPIVALAAAFAFLKINDRPFVYFFLSFINYYLKPRLYIFSNAPRKIESKVAEEKIVETPSLPQEKITRSKLKDLALSLDTGSKKLNHET